MVFYVLISHSFSLVHLILKAPTTAAADDKFRDIFPNFLQN